MDGKIIAALLTIAYCNQNGKQSMDTMEVIYSVYLTYLKMIEG